MDSTQLFTSKNQRLTVSVDAQIPSSLLALLFGDAYNDSAARAHSEDPGATGEPATKELAARKTLLHNTIYAPSIDGRYLVVAYTDRYMLLECPSDSKTPSNYSLMSVGNEGASSGERVTALYCMNIYAAHHGQKQPNGAESQSMCVIVGYSSGYMRIFSMYGHLLTSHQFHTQPLLRIRLRMPSQANSEQTAGEVRYIANSSYGYGAEGGSGDNIMGGGVHKATVREDTEEVCLMYADGVMVSIDGKSLYLALRLCLNEAVDGLGEADEPIFQYKKWEFELNTPLVSDAVSYGPASHRDPLALLAKGTLTSSPILSDATARFLVAPQQGNAVFGVFMTNEDAAMSFSAVDIAGKMAAKVTGAVLSIARSYFWRANPLSSASSDSTSQNATSRGESGTMVPCAFAVRDGTRKVLEISLAPAQYNLAALTDSLGRVLIFDLESCEIIHMLKGLRGSQCAWLETVGSRPLESYSGLVKEGRIVSRRMFVVVYTARRGIVEVFELGAMERPIASANIGSEWKLVQCPSQPLGGSLVVGSARKARRAALPTLATCMLINNVGQIAHVTINDI
ncbi:hypothetical protein GGI25_003236 [Coemansia spiralis]|uniref:Rab3-GAP regulatory subunit N-terminal domain-containing protein n=2 Tax=Coemansia TaxID=4863 RepID=A0A9W8G714_9FUNG|nr:Rab3 GTPase-activating protein regulatory subunit N-terminus-domain-containing protein [Coemansia spiralis]KAJ1987600.1 hypothetical protein EDC05_005742 [Coemansia umbellata]KAJ2619402.1 hypothetical protein GGI26_005863 [Coemansia sp. RSA 1358]KAJ2677141.1 hypothetical protein GGI25_003236 [Coemansia spiralis]